MTVRNTWRHAWRANARLDNRRGRLTGFESLEPRQLLAAEPIISELMAVNQQSLADDDGEFHDWLELSNIGDERASLSGWHLTDDPAQPDQWTLPDVTLDPGQQLVIFASGKDRRQTDAVLHTNFRLTGDGEYLGLVTPTGNVAHEYLPSFPPQVADVAYGLYGPDLESGYFAIPSPGEPNLQPPSATPWQDLVINEIMYHPSSNNVADEYIELRNNGSEIVDVAGWKITGGVDVVLPSATIEPGELLVVAADVEQFRSTYGESIRVVGPWLGQLSNSRDTIKLRDAVDRLHDQVTYADEGDWAQRMRGPLDEGHRGWVWSDQHDGGGSSLELQNAELPNQWGQNWAASQQAGGSPGQPNAAAVADSAPLIVDIQQRPEIPAATDTVRITVTVVDESVGSVSTTLHWRVDGSPEFSQLVMSDDGMNGDAFAGDGVFYAQLPAHPDRTVVEYYVASTDQAAQRRTWPASVAGGGQSTNALYQVIDEFDPSITLDPTTPPIFYQIMTAAERDEFQSINRSSNAQMNATVVSVNSDGIEMRHNAGVRIRGSGSRGANPPNNRVNLPADRPLDGTTAINFNVDTVRNQVAGSVLFRLAGLPAAEANGARMYSNGADLMQGGQYAQVEPLGSEFADKHFPLDSGGNVYKGRRSNESPPGGLGAGLRYFGEDPAPYVSYTKLTNESLAD